MKREYANFYFLSYCCIFPSYTFVILVCVCFQVLGRGEKWTGGDYMSAPGGGQKVRLLKAALLEMKSEYQVLLFIDRYELTFTSR